MSRNPLRVFGLVIMTERRWLRDVDAIMDVGYACGRITVKQELGMLPANTLRKLSRRLRVVK